MIPPSPMPKILKQFGFEMFSFHNAYHNGTMAEFWSTHTNHRTDEYGGSAKNRARLMIEVMDAMKQTFGRDFPIEMLISVDGLGVNRGDTFELAKLLEGKVEHSPCAPRGQGSSASHRLYLLPCSALSQSGCRRRIEGIHYEPGRFH